MQTVQYKLTAASPQPAASIYLRKPLQLKMLPRKPWFTMYGDVGFMDVPKQAFLYFLELFV